MAGFSIIALMTFIIPVLLAFLALLIFLIIYGIVCYFLKSTFIYKVSKNKNYNYPITSWIPFYNNVNLGKYSTVKLTSRFGSAVMPEVDLIDMRQNQPVKESWGKTWLSNVLVKQIEEKLEKKEQIMLYINRRGYAPLVLCSACGHRLQCPNCNVYLTAHSKDDTKCCCHHCGYSMRLPKICPKCEKEDTYIIGGTSGDLRAFSE